MTKIWGGIEAGGSHFVCAVGTGPDHIIDEATFPTTTPSETLRKTIAFFSNRKNICGIGIGSFGPIDLDVTSDTFGWITSTPKAGWENTDFLGKVEKTLSIPTRIDTDVNAAALSEYLWGNAQNVDNFMYITVGTGIGGSTLIDGKPIPSLTHTEFGHIQIPRNKDIDDFTGCCLYHQDCLEGLASGPAILMRWGYEAHKLEKSHPAWELEAHYLGLAITNAVCTLSPKRIIIGGGIMKHPLLLGQVRLKTQAILNNYIQSKAISSRIEEYIVSPKLGDRSGVLGAIGLAKS